MTTATIEAFRPAFDAFMAEDAEGAILDATHVDDSGETRNVELFEDGSYRLLWGGEIGNLYESPGIILTIPPLTQDEWNQEEEAFSWFEEALNDLQERFEEPLEEE